MPRSGNVLETTFIRTESAIGSHYRSVQNSDDDPSAPLLTPSALTTAMTRGEIATYVGKRFFSTVTSILSLVVYFVILYGNATLTQILSSLGANGVLGFYFAEGTMAHIADVREGEASAQAKLKDYVVMAVSGAVVSVGAALISYQSAKENPTTSSDFWIVLSVVAGILSTFTLGMTTLGAAGKILKKIDLQIKASRGSKLAQQKLAFLNLLTDMKSHMAHAPLTRFAQENDNILDKKDLKAIFKGYQIKETSEGMPLLSDVGSDRTGDSQRLLNMMSDLFSHAQAAQTTENKSRVANYFSGPIPTVIGKGLLNGLYGIMLLAFPYILFTSSIGYLWTAALALIDLGLSASVSLAVSIVCQSLNVVLNVVAGVELATLVKDFIASFVEYGALPNQLTAGGKAGMLLNLLFGVIAGGVISAESGASSYAVYAKSLNCTLPSPEFLLQPAEGLSLSAETVISNGAAAFNGYYVIVALIQLINYLIISRLDYFRSPEHLNAQIASEHIEALITEVRKLSPNKISRLCEALEGQEGRDHKPLGNALRSAGVFSGTQNGHHSAVPAAPATESGAESSRSTSLRSCNVM